MKTSKKPLVISPEISMMNEQIIFANISGMKSIIDQINEGNTEGIPANITPDSLNESIQIHNDFYAATRVIASIANPQKLEKMYAIIEEHTDTLQNTKEQTLEEKVIERIDLNIAGWNRIKANIDFIRKAIENAEENDHEIVDRICKRKVD